MGGIPDETDGARLARMGTDAAVWAEEFAERMTHSHTGGPVECKPNPAPGGTFHVWLCAAIEAGRSAGYSQGQRDAEADAEQLAAYFERSGRAGAADAVRGSLTGWPVVVADSTDAVRTVPADLAGSHAADPAGSEPADSAGRTVPADLAGSADPFGWPTPEAEETPLDRIAEALERIAAAVAPHGHPGGAGIRVIGDGR